MPKRFCVARNERGYIVTYGFGPTPALAEISCRNHVISEKKEGKVAHYEPYRMPKPKFRLGQKVRRTDLPSIVVKVAGLPDNPMSAGTICTGTALGLFTVWESENRFEAAR